MTYVWRCRAEGRSGARHSTDPTAVEAGGDPSQRAGIAINLCWRFALRPSSISVSIHPGVGAVHPTPDVSDRCSRRAAASFKDAIKSIAEQPFGSSRTFSRRDGWLRR